MRSSEWVKKTNSDPNIDCLQETHIIYIYFDIDRLQVRGWKTYNMQMPTKRKFGGFIKIRVDFRQKNHQR